ncbi:MAG: hypothetical protein ACMVO3_22840 [Thalassobaculum sp.]
MILALDLGTKTGWAAAEREAPFLPPISDDETAARRAVRHYVHGVFKGPPGDHAKLAQRFEGFLNRRIQTLDVSFVVIEAQTEFPQKSRNAAQILLGLKMVAEKVARQNGIPCVLVETSEMQVHAVGTKRDAKKKKRGERLAALGLTGIDDNEGDAIFVLSTWLAKVAARNREAAE